MEESPYCTLEEFATACGLSQVTIRRYVRNGRIASVQPGGPGHRILIPRDALQHLEQTRTANASNRVGAEKPVKSESRSGPKPWWQSKPPSNQP